MYTKSDRGHRVPSVGRTCSSSSDMLYVQIIREHNTYYYNGPKTSSSVVVGVGANRIIIRLELSSHRV